MQPHNSSSNSNFNNNKIFIINNNNNNNLLKKNIFLSTLFVFIHPTTTFYTPNITMESPQQENELQDHHFDRDDTDDGILLDGELITSSFMSSSTATIPDVAAEVPGTGSESNKNRMEEYLSRRVHQLSLQEGEQVLFDIHGLPQLTDEDPADIDNYYIELENEIQSILSMQDDDDDDDDNNNNAQQERHHVDINKQAYIQAERQNYDYVHGEQFRRMFLRAVRFNIKEAAQNIIYHFQVKRALFCSVTNEECLGRDIRFSDLSDDDKTSLHSGYMQLLQDRDANGRSILWLRPIPGVHKSPESVMRASWYMMMNILRDDETQKKGVVFVLYNTGCNNRDGYAMLKQFRMNQNAVHIPRKVVAMHFCTDDPQPTPYTEIHNTPLINDKMKVRFRTHIGSHTETLFKLQTYGIPIDDPIVQGDGSLPKEWHQQWLQILQNNEQKQQQQQLAVAINNNNVKNDDGHTKEQRHHHDEEIILPTKVDVLFGRGKESREHPGNLRCMAIIEEQRGPYESASKYKKTEIAERIVFDVYNAGGRFLKMDHQYGWQEVDEETAREKVSHYFRALRGKAKTTTATTTATTSSSNASANTSYKRGVVSDDEASRSSQCTQNRSNRFVVSHKVNPL
jgi:hypothetical protein